MLQITVPPVIYSTSFFCESVRFSLLLSIFILVPFCSLSFILYELIIINKSCHLFMSLLFHRIHNSIIFVRTFTYRISTWQNLTNSMGFNCILLQTMAKYSPFLRKKLRLLALLYRPSSDKMYMLKLKHPTKNPKISRRNLHELNRCNLLVFTNSQYVFKITMLNFCKQMNSTWNPLNCLLLFK